MNSIIYLLQVTACTAVFYLFYYLFLNRLTFFVTNRWYLLVTVLLSFVIPLIKIPLNQPHAYTGVVQQVVYTYTPRDFIPGEDVLKIQPIVAKSKPVHWGDVLKFAYLTAVLALTIHLAITLLAFFKRLKGKLITKVGKINILSGNDKITNGSFLNYIFLNNQELSADEIQQIIAHEMLHVKLYHSLDRIIVKIAQIVLWFNPFIYLYARSVEENHEFEVDRAVARDTDKHNYANLLLHLSVVGQGLLYHNFSKVPLKKRITMLFNQPSANMKKIVYVLIVPVVLISCLAFAGLKSNSKVVAGKKYEITISPTKKGLPTMKEWIAFVKKYSTTPEGKRRLALAEAMRGKTIVVIVASVINNKYVKNRVDHISFRYNGDDYNMSFGYSDPLRVKNMVNAGDQIKIQIKSLSFFYLNDSLEIWPSAIYKDGEKIFVTKDKSNPAGIVKNTTAMTERSLDADQHVSDDMAMLIPFFKRTHYQYNDSKSKDKVTFTLSDSSSASASLGVDDKVGAFIDGKFYNEADISKLGAEKTAKLVFDTHPGFEGYKLPKENYAIPFKFKTKGITNDQHDQQPLKDTSKSFGLTKKGQTLEAYEKTKDYEKKKQLVDAVRNKVVNFKVKKILKGKVNGYLVSKGNNDYLLIASYGYKNLATMPLKPGDDIIVGVRTAGLTKDMPPLIWAEYVWKGGVKLFQAPTINKVAAVADTRPYKI